MSVVVSLDNFRPPKRFDAIPWTEARIYEADAFDGTFSLIDTAALSPVDVDPESPAYRDFTTSSGTADEQWYRIVFADGAGNISAPTVAIQNVSTTTPDVVAYATTEELARVLKLRAVTDEQEVAMQRCLDAASLEIDKEVGNTTPYTDPPQLVVAVCLDRAVEHWRQTEVPFGITGMGDQAATYIARDPWERHAFKLAPLKTSWGLA